MAESKQEIRKFKNEDLAAVRAANDVVTDDEFEVMQAKIAFDAKKAAHDAKVLARARAVIVGMRNAGVANAKDGLVCYECGTVRKPAFDHQGQERSFCPVCPRPEKA